MTCLFLWFLSALCSLVLAYASDDTDVLECPDSPVVDALLLATFFLGECLTAVIAFTCIAAFFDGVFVGVTFFVGVLVGVTFFVGVLVGVSFFVGVLAGLFEGVVTSDEALFVGVSPALVGVSFIGVCVQVFFTDVAGLPACILVCDKCFVFALVTDFVKSVCAIGFLVFVDCFSLIMDL